MLIWVQTVCKVNQQIKKPLLAGKELISGKQESQTLMRQLMSSLISIHCKHAIVICFYDPCLVVIRAIMPNFELQ